MRPRFLDRSRWTLPPNGKPAQRVEKELVTVLGGSYAQLLEWRVQSG